MPTGGATSATLAATAALALASAVLAGCGEKTINADRAGDTVANIVNEETGFEPEDVSCPEDVDAEEGGTFQCKFTGPDGDYIADVEITEVDGDDAVFAVETRRSN